MPSGIPRSRLFIISNNVYFINPLGENSLLSCLCILVILGFGFLCLVQGHLNMWPGIEGETGSQTDSGVLIESWHIGVFVFKLTRD